MYQKKCEFFWESGVAAVNTDAPLSEYCTLNCNHRIKWAISQTGSSHNDLQSNLCLCPDDLTFMEFREFVAFRTGHRLQLRNLYRALEQRTLSLESDSVLALILQSLWQAGPPVTCSNSESIHEDRKWVRDSHMDLLCPYFSSKLIDLCLSVVERYSTNWKAYRSLLAIESVLSRVASLTPDAKIKSQAISAQIRCLNISRNWIDRLKSLLSESRESEETNKLRLYLIKVCCCAIYCFFQDIESLQLLSLQLARGMIVHYHRSLCYSIYM